MAERGRKLEAYECTNCHGTGKILTDWQAYADSYVPVGFDTQPRKSPYSQCKICKGRGFTVEPEEAQHGSV